MDTIGKYKEKLSKGVVRILDIIESAYQKGRKRGELSRKFDSSGAAGDGPSMLSLYASKIINVIERINKNLQRYSPTTLIAFFLLTLLVYYLAAFIFTKVIKALNCIKEKGVKGALTDIYLSTSIGKKKEAEMHKSLRKTFKDVFNSSKFKKLEFRDNKQDETTVVQKIINMSSTDDEKSNSGRLTGAVYCSEQKIRKIGGEALKAYSYSNLLHADVYNGARFIESELIKIGINLFNGKEDACGMTTTGGTGSILAAMWSYVNRGRKLGFPQEKMNIIVPESAHAAFFKACDMFNVKLVKIPLDKVSYKVDINRLRKKINKYTVCIVGSCPNFPHGIADDIEALSSLAVKYGVPLHVDCCLGGFLVAFYQSANIKFQKFDFLLPGVTSISADLHKYGLCPKGISLLLFANRDYRQNCYFTYPHFMGGIYCTPSFDGSRTAGLSAASYSILISVGKQFYINIAKKIYQAVIKVKNFINSECSDVIEMIGDPCICAVAFKGKKVEYIYDEMGRRKWHLNYIMNPTGCSFVFTYANVENVDQFIKDLKESCNLVREGKCQELSEMTKLYGMTMPLPSSLASGALNLLIDAMLD